jgi:peptide chain release factor 1
MRIIFRDSDFDVEWFSGTGKGGQHRNKHENCCRIRHRETGIVAVGQRARNREANRRAAFATMRMRLIEHYTPQTERRTDGDRIRTYHEPRNEVIDHASGVRSTYSKIVIEGDIGIMIEARKTAL